MYTGIVSGVEKLVWSDFSETFGRLRVSATKDFVNGLKIGGSVAVDGVCLSVTHIQAMGATNDSTLERYELSFDIINPTVLRSALAGKKVGDLLNVERSAAIGDENGGHELSGHIDCVADVIKVERVGQNMMLELQVPESTMRYVFPQGFIGVNGCSLTISDVKRDANTFCIWLIPETRRLTNLNDLQVGSHVNIEFHKGVQAMVDTVERSIERVVRQMLAGGEVSLESLGQLAELGLTGKKPKAIDPKGSM